MPLHSAVRRRLNLTRASIPSFIEAWPATFGEHADDQFDALRGTGDARSPLFDRLTQALPEESQGLLLSSRRHGLADITAVAAA